MPRASRQEAERHRVDVVDAASKLFREHGITGVSVPALMAEAGLTHGGFYGHFKSKEALAAEACADAFAKKRDEYDAIIDHHDDAGAFADFVKRYTSKNHRDSPGMGCPVAALAGDVARLGPKSRIRTAYVAGISMMTERLASILSPRRKALTRQAALTRMATLVGGLMIARAAKGHEISGEMLDAVRQSFLDE